MRWKANVTKPQASWGAKPLKKSIAKERGESIGNGLESVCPVQNPNLLAWMPLSLACRIQ
jgi:hypothetical protein